MPEHVLLVTTSPMTETPFRSLILFTFLCILKVLVPGQTLPNLEHKPTPKYPTKNIWCPKEGTDGSDSELNLAKNRTDKSTKYYPVSFEEIRNLHGADSLAEHDRDELTTPRFSQAAIDVLRKNEGIPIRLEGYLLLVKDGSKMVGGIREGAETPNCGEKVFEHVDYHLWLVRSPGDSFKDAVVIEMTPRVRASHSRWSDKDKLEKDLNYLANNKIRLRVYGWLLFDGEHKEQLYDPTKLDKKGVRRATLWEIHPIMRIEKKGGSSWKVW